MKKISILIVTFFMCVPLFAAPSGFNLYMAAGPNFIFPYSVRVGYGDWEGGILSGGVIGASKSFQISGTNYYSSFGIGSKISDYQPSIGLQIGAGFDYNLIGNFSLRGELMANAFFNASTISHGLLGVAYGF